MGTSTVSGPFRSANGFQELDSNGQWVPVAGGGGGGVTSIIAGSGISVSAPTGAVTISATGGGGGGTNILMQWGDFLALPAPTAIGQVYEVDVAYNYNGFGLPSITIELPVIGNGYNSVFIGSVFLQDSNDFPPPPIVGMILSDIFEIVYNPDKTLGWANFRIVYLGPVTADGETYNVFQAFANMTTFNAG